MTVCSSKCKKRAQVGHKQQCNKVLRLLNHNRVILVLLSTLGMDFCSHSDLVKLRAYVSLTKKKKWVFLCTCHDSLKMELKPHFEACYLLCDAKLFFSAAPENVLRINAKFNALHLPHQPLMSCRLESNQLVKIRIWTGLDRGSTIWDLPFPYPK